MKGTGKNGLSKTRQRQLEREKRLAAHTPECPWCSGKIKATCRFCHGTGKVSQRDAYYLVYQRKLESRLARTVKLLLLSAPAMLVMNELRNVDAMIEKQRIETPFYCRFSSLSKTREWTSIVERWAEEHRKEIEKGLA